MTGLLVGIEQSNQDQKIKPKATMKKATPGRLTRVSRSCSVILMVTPSGMIE